MKVRLCHCTQCKYGLRHSKKVKKLVRLQCQAARSRAKQLIHMGRYENAPVAISIDYIG